MTSTAEAGLQPLRGIRSAWRRFARGLGDLMPKGLFARSLIIIIAPVVLLQALVAFVFMEEHWRQVTARLSEAVVADIAAVVDLLELGALLDRRPHTLSGGERQRVAVGRALLSRPRALLLDEPLTGLHAEARVQVLDYLRRLKQELRVFTVLVTHHADEVGALADEVVRLAGGRIVRQVPIAEFVARRAAFADAP